jgi:hypothetical protein
MAVAPVHYEKVGAAVLVLALVLLVVAVCVAVMHGLLRAL